MSKFFKVKGILVISFLILNNSLVKAEEVNLKKDVWATGYFCPYDTEFPGQTHTKTISGKSYTLKASFLFGGIGVPMQGKGRTGPGGDYIAWKIGTGGVLVPITDAIKQHYKIKIGITDFTGFGNLALERPEEAEYEVVSSFFGAIGTTLTHWYSIAVNAHSPAIPIRSKGVLHFKDGAKIPEGYSCMPFYVEDTGGGKDPHGNPANWIDVYVGEGNSARQTWPGNRYVDLYINAQRSIFTLQEAAQQGLIEIKSKGGYFGDKITFIGGPNPNCVIVKVRKGDVFVSKNPNEQNLVATKDLTICIPPKQIVRLEGIWVACIDASEGAPDKNDILDVTYNLRDWNLNTAFLLSRLLEVIDGANLHEDENSQYAIWKITDNKSVSSQGARDLLIKAGIDPDAAILGFPRLSNPNMSSTETGFTVPSEIPPQAPTNLQVEAVRFNEVKLTWRDNSDNEQGFKIERKKENGTYAEIATVGKNITSYQDKNLEPQTTYYYRVKAYSQSGDSFYSNEAQVKTPQSEPFSKENVYNYPNPFNPDKETTNIRFTLEESANVKIKIFDIAGDLVWSKELSASAGETLVPWDGKNEEGEIVANGVYIYRVTADGESVIKKIAVLR